MPPNPAINHLAFVQAARAKFDNLPSGAERAWRTVNETALQLRAKGEDAGLFAKAGGSGYVVNGVLYSVDVLMYQSTETFDCLQDAEGIARPQWGPTSPSGHGPASAFRLPIGAVTPPTPEPPEPEPPDPPDPEPPADDPVIERLDILIAAMARVLNELSVIRAQVTRPWATSTRVPVLGEAKGTSTPPAV